MEMAPPSDRSPSDRPPSDPRQYIRLAAFLRKEIASGRLGPGSRLPSITVLCRERKTSRRTAARAMRVLESEGLIQRVPGLGYFVRNDLGDL
ncbi:MAG TPA: winged helix-turn-helix domain-containing protein [Streptosporangiaceae bacterium]